MFNNQDVMSDEELNAIIERNNKKIEEIEKRTQELERMNRKIEIAERIMQLKTEISEHKTQLDHIRSLGFFDLQLKTEFNNKIKEVTALIRESSLLNNDGDRNDKQAP